ncbi:MAG: hypothetical protein C5B51_07085 [Terriglobia bacterium]|nr:MAG: hypothetical protein C5B51_07085 [Terriglobia bacterium]
MSVLNTPSLFKSALLLAAAGSLAFAYPDSGTMTVTGPSDFVGTFVLNNGTQSFSGYGGGYTGTVVDTVTNQSNTQLLFCNDFSNDISIPSGPMAVKISALTNSSDISQTRFGKYAVNGYRGINVPLSSSQITTLSTNTETILNGASTLERYQMAAYLVSQYAFLGDHPAGNIVHGDSESRGIQEAIWTLLDAKGLVFTPPSDASQGGQTGNVTTYLTAAANWLQNGDRSFLSRFFVITDASMQGLNSGVQELLMYTPAVPEPRFGVILGAGLLALLWKVRRYRRA